jgi:hypothetical protein
MLHGTAIERVTNQVYLFPIQMYTHRRGTYMVGAYRCSKEAETNGFRDQKIQVHTQRQATLVATMHTLCLTSAILTWFGTVRRERMRRERPHCLC